MNKLKTVRLLAVFATASLVFLSLTGCPGGTPPATTPPVTPTPSDTPTAFPCPPLPPTFRTGCPGFDITAMALACSSPPTRIISPIPGPTEGTRIEVTIPDGSTITSSVFPLDPFCNRIGPAKPITITLGVTYVGDDSSVRPLCISRSKATFSQFGSTDPLVSAFSGQFKEMFHLEMDRAVVETLTGAPAASPRCSFWRPMP